MNDTGAGSKGLVLVVDDDTAVADSVCRFLASYGYEALQANDGVSGAALARARRPRVVLLDISMPGKDGVEVLKELVPELPRTGFIMLSGNGDEEVALACLKLGAFDYLAKPANLGALETMVRTFLAGVKL